MRRRQESALTTTLGAPLRRHGEHWTIDLTGLPLFHGLSVLSRALGEQVVERCQAECFDIDVERRLKAAENPELAALGCAGVTVHAERDVVAHVPEDVEAFQHHLRAVFGTLQQERWRRYLLTPDPSEPPRALVFTFHVEDRFEYRFVLDRVPAPRSGHRFYLRIAVENPAGRRLDLDTIPHVIVDDLEEREYIAGSTRIAQTLSDMVRREVERGRRVHFERRKPGAFVFAQLARGGLGEIAVVHLSWSDRLAGSLATASISPFEHTLKRVLLLLEDRTARRELQAGQAIELIDGELRTYLDLSQHGRVLNVAFDQARHRASVETYLQRMPALEAVARQRTSARPLSGLSVLLIHHITSEVLAFTSALRALGCEDLDILFVRYAGEIPNDYVDAMLDLDQTVRSYTLTNVQDPGEIEGHFVPSHQLSPTTELETLETALRARRARFLEAMIAVAVRLFLRAVERGQRVLVVEDGGYLMPALNRAAMTGATVGALAAEYGAGPVPAALARRSLRALLDERLVGSVEHTRNGFDRLSAVEREVGLVRPAYSIAISRLKVEEEAREVASGILTGVETVLHACGHVLSRRRALVIGSRGAIGRQLMAALRTGRVPADQILGLDLVVPRGGAGEARLWRDLPPAERRGVDLILGVTGCSVLGDEETEELLLHGTAPTVFFASGSTKTVEFSDVAAWVERTAGNARPKLGRQPVSIRSADLTDPQSGRRYGTSVTLRVGKPGSDFIKTFVFIANLTPVNFLFYGVPTEAMDRVMAQLLATSLALVRDVGRRRPPAPRLYAVDRDIPASQL